VPLCKNGCIDAFTRVVHGRTVSVDETSRRQGSGSPASVRRS
jgi:hypothetical protein